MSSTAIPTDARPAAPVRLSVTSVRALLALVVLAVVWISFTPFQIAPPTAEIEDAGGLLVNQIGYTAILALALAAMIVAVDRRALANLFSTGWLAMFALVGLSAFTAADPAGAARSVMFALIATTMAASIMILVPNAISLSRVFAIAAALVLGLSYAGLLLFPDKAIHQAAGVEAFHAGLWRGIYSHKNLAGPVMASLVFVGIYLMRRGQVTAGAAIAVLALVFLWNTGSKTSAALVPAIVSIVVLPVIAGQRFVAALFVLAAMFAIHAMTIARIHAVAGHHPEIRHETTTYTGRTEIWEFAGGFVLDRPWTGFGFDSFWGTSVAAGAEQPFDRSWDPRGIIHGHNGFLDIALFMGIPALLLAVWLFVLAPVWHYLRTPNYRENVLLADLCLMIVAFLVMNSALESFFLRRADPAWLTLVIALTGLRLCSRLRLRDC